MNYSREAIDMTRALVNGDKRAKQWLENNHLEELVQLNDAVSRHAHAFEYLLVNKFVILAAFVNAVWEDKKAFALLMEQRAFHWAAMANFINGDENAEVFLRKNRMDH